MTLSILFSPLYYKRMLYAMKAYRRHVYCPIQVQKKMNIERRKKDEVFVTCLKSLSQTTFPNHSLTSHHEEPTHPKLPVSPF